MELREHIDRFVPVELSVDCSFLSERDREALNHLYEAARFIDEIYLRQVWNNNPALLEKLRADTSTLGKLRLQYFLINMGPWSQLDGGTAFIDGVPPTQPPHANFYPLDMSKEEFLRWIETLSSSEREEATGFFTVIRRTPQGTLRTVPYSVEYGEWLEPAAKELEKAANLTTYPSLKKYLQLRAKAFRTNDYYESDCAWLELDAPIDVTIGPYETYMDKLFGYKAAFEAFITIRDNEATKKLTTFVKHLQDIENNLPIEPKYRNPKIAPMAPIRVVDVLFATGDGNSGVQTAAFNLPNDERILLEKGAKRVMLKNIQEAKFNNILVPIAHTVLDTSQYRAVSFDAFFTHILAHELVHGLGPHSITVEGRATTVRKELKELYSTIEEAKADITGLFALQYLIDRGILPTTLEEEMYVTFLASMFRSVRFGITEAHGRGVALQFNYLTLEGAIGIDDPHNKFRINIEKAKEATRKLASEILTLQAEGSYRKAKALVDRFAILHPAMERALTGLRHIPIDIQPRYRNVPPKAGSIR
ncbi:MAG: hypothetical protein N3A63_10070 [Bacteroidetes bacterium]|nr:hypothetical protein [Bacteroidota bacterium]